MNIEYIDHKNYPKRLRTKSDDDLRYIIKDCKEAIEANPLGHKVGYYLDEIHYCIMELNRRQ